MTWMDRLKVDWVAGDLFTTDVEAIACNVNATLYLNYELGAIVGPI